MATTVQDHYDTLLAEHYDWMFGTSFAAKVEEQKGLLKEVAGEATRGAFALDLGCGSGFQSVALHELGYRVLAVDVSEQLLAALAARAPRGITTRLTDLRRLEELVDPGTVDVAVCMGDTLTHLSSRAEVSELFHSVAHALKPHGVFVVTYRDLSTAELKGLDRFIPVRADDERIMTCVLEYESPDHVLVNDLIYARDSAGHWALRKSSYRKLRLPLEWVRNELVASGLSIQLQQTGRMVTLAAARLG
jgi:SAM-dependent methyltransferase